MEIWRLRSFGYFLLSIAFCWDPVQYKWHRHGFYHLRNPVSWRWSFPVHRKVTLDGTTQSWDIWDGASVYVGCFWSIHILNICSTNTQFVNTINTYTRYIR
jgi:hypothetical protein